MNNLPIITGNPQTAAKPAPATASPAAQTAKSAQIPQSVQQIEENSPEGKSFGDVLARQVQVSDATPEDKSQPIITAKPLKSAQAAKISDENALIMPALGETFTVQSADATPVEDTFKPKKVTSKADEIFAHIKARNNDAKTTPAPNDNNANVPPGALAATVPLAAATTTLLDTAAQPKKTAIPASGPNNSLGLNLDQVAGNQELPVSKSISQSSSAVPAGAKKDANFTNMMDTITASTAKIMGNDDKAAALAAAPQPNANTQATLLAATAPIAAASVMPVQVTINTPVAHDNWGDEFNQKITWLSNQKEQTAELHLNPPQLGPMDVVLKVSGDQATALFTSPHAAVREAVEQALPRLREMMAESGIMLGNATVSDQAPRGRQGDNDNKPSGSRTTTGRISETSRPVSQNVRVSPISRHNGIVDTFA